MLYVQYCSRTLPCLVLDPPLLIWLALALFFDKQNPFLTKILASSKGV